MNKPKLNEPDVEQSITKPHIETIKSPIIRDGYKQYENYCPHCKYQITILGNYCPNCGKPIDWGHNNVETTTLPYKKVLIQPDPTIEEVKKEWEDDGWEWKEGGVYIELIKNNEDYNIEISIDKIDKTYCCFEDDDCDQTSLRITFQEHIRLTKTFRALDWEV